MKYIKVVHSLHLPTRELAETFANTLSNGADENLKDTVLGYLATIEKCSDGFHMDFSVYLDTAQTPFEAASLLVIVGKAAMKGLGGDLFVKEAPQEEIDKLKIEHHIARSKERQEKFFQAPQELRDFFNAARTNLN